MINVQSMKIFFFFGNRRGYRFFSHCIELKMINPSKVIIFLHGERLFIYRVTKYKYYANNFSSSNKISCKLYNISNMLNGGFLSKYFA